MRIVSLLPSATEIIVALGLGDDLVGVTHACDVAGVSARIPALTRPLPGRAEASPAARHEHAEAEAHAGAAAFDLDERLLVELRPDLVLVQERCPACEASYRPIGTEARRLLGRQATVLSLEPVSIDGILHSIATVGAMTAAEDEAVGLVELLRERLADVEEEVEARRGAGHRPPRVAALDWLSPPIAVGHWVPEQVRRAGGWDLLGREGERSRPTSWADIRELDPEMIVLMPCGLGLRDVVEAWSGTRRPPGWGEIQAVRRGQVFAVDARAYFSRPGPSVIDGIELLAEVFDPGGFEGLAPVAGWRPVA